MDRVGAGPGRGLDERGDVQVGVDLEDSSAARVIVGVAFGVVPALKTSQPDLHASLKERGRGSSGPRLRTQNVFVAVEMALAVVLLAGAGLMVRSLVGLANVDPVLIRST